MAGTSDPSFSSEELDALKQKLSEFARESLSERQQGLMVAIFAVAAERAEIWSDPGHGELPKIKVKDTEREIGIDIRTDVNELISQLRGAFTPGGDRTGTVCCVVPVIPVIPPPPVPGPYPGHDA